MERVAWHIEDGSVPLVALGHPSCPTRQLCMDCAWQLLVGRGYDDQKRPPGKNFGLHFWSLSHSCDRKAGYARDIRRDGKGEQAPFPSIHGGFVNLEETTSITGRRLISIKFVLLSLQKKSNFVGANFFFIKRRNTKSRYPSSSRILLDGAKRKFCSGNGYQIVPKNAVQCVLMRG